MCVCLVQCVRVCVCRMRIKDDKESNLLSNNTKTNCTRRRAIGRQNSILVTALACRGLEIGWDQAFVVGDGICANCLSFSIPFYFYFWLFSSENCDTGSAKNVTEYEAALPRAAVYVVRQRCEFVNDCIFTPLYLSRLSPHLFWTFFISSSWQKTKRKENLLILPCLCSLLNNTPKFLPCSFRLSLLFSTAGSM